MHPKKALLAHIAKKFADPITATQYVKTSGLNVSVQHVKRWCAKEFIFEAGRVRQPRGAPAMLYCCDSRTALSGRLRWLAEEYEREGGS